MIRLFRLSRYDALDGEGSRLNGGRWNSRGIPAVYMSPTLPESAVELLKSRVNRVEIDKNYYYKEIKIVELLIDEFEITEATLSVDFPLSDTQQTKKIGNDFIKNTKGKVGLWVPSARFKENRNVLLNPTHPRFQEIIRGNKKVKLLHEWASI